MEIYYSKFNDPYYHLGVEDWFLRNTNPSDEYLIFYRNSPSVVMGRFQNPWIEANLPLMADKGINLVRRMSGGGTVYHDLGNINIAYIGPLQNFKRDKILNWFKQEMSKAGVDVDINQRFDLIYNQKKVSGSAYKQTKEKVLHHFTFLVSTHLDDLISYIVSPFQLHKTLSIPSVRSKVMNLSEAYPFLSWDWLLNFYHAQPLPDLSVMTTWSERDWIFGETPYFEWEWTKHDLKYFLKSRKGKIEEFYVNHELVHDLTSQWFCSDVLTHVLGPHHGTKTEWIKLTGY